MMTDNPEPPSFAVSARVQHADWNGADFQRKHDLREGRRLDYVDHDRAKINSVLIAPPTPDVLRGVCEERRAARETKAKRAMRSDAAIASHVLISFGKGAQPIFEALPVAVQDEAMQAVAARIARELGSTVVGLVVHRDESAHHAHVTMPAVAINGDPLSKVVNRAVAARMQDWAAEEMAAFAPSIVRGKPKADRIAAGEPRHRIVHRSVRELHNDLPGELQEARDRVAEMQAKVDALKDRAEMSDLEAKRLEVYSKRLDDRRLEVARAEGRLEALQIRAQEAASNRVADEHEATKVLGRAVTEAARLVSEAQEQAAIIRDHARDDAAIIRAEVVEEVRIMVLEVQGMREDLRHVLRASTEFVVRRPGKVLLDRLDDFINRVGTWLRGSVRWSELSPPAPSRESDPPSTPGPT